VTTPTTHLLPCGRLRTIRGAHRRACPDFETVETDPTARGLDRYRWVPRKKDFAMTDLARVVTDITFRSGGVRTHFSEPMPRESAEAWVEEGNRDRNVNAISRVMSEADYQAMLTEDRP
jgi:hypothetical protein